jgi:hypothetical protein
MSWAIPKQPPAKGSDGSSRKRSVGLRGCAPRSGARSKPGIFASHGRCATLRDNRWQDSAPSAICRTRSGAIPADIDLKFAKRRMYYTCDKPDKFLPEVTEALAAFGDQSITEIPDVGAGAKMLFALGASEMTRSGLTTYSNQRAMEVLRLGNAWRGSIEARHRLLYGYRAPVHDKMTGPDDDRDALVGCGKPLPWE